MAPKSCLKRLGLTPWLIVRGRPSTIQHSTSARISRHATNSPERFMGSLRSARARLFWDRAWTIGLRIYLEAEFCPGLKPGVDNHHGPIQSGCGPSVCLSRLRLRLTTWRAKTVLLRRGTSCKLTLSRRPTVFLRL